MSDGLKEWKKPEVEDISSEEPGKDKAELTDEQKDHIREDLESESEPGVKIYDTPEKASKRRKQLAVFYGTTVKQIAAVSAYKKDGDELSLKPKFEKPPVALPQIEAEYDTLTKRAWRQKIFDAIKSDFTPEQLQRARVLCLPGQALQEVTEVYLPLGIRPENIICIEKDNDVANTMRANARKLRLPVTIFEGSLERFLQKSHEPISIASFDLLGPMYEGFLVSLLNMRVADKFMVITNCLRRREQKNQQDVLKSITSTVRSTGNALDLLENYAHVLPSVGSESLAVNNLIGQIAKTIRKPVDLSEARDEGAAVTLISFLLEGQARQSLNDLYSEANTVPPQFKSDNDRQAFEENMLRTLMRGIEQLITNYPRVYSRLSLKTDVNIAESTPTTTDVGKHGFLLHFVAVARHCMSDLTICDLERYEYLSEKSGSPYQTDVITLLDWKRNFREKHRDAYHFIRDCLRVIGQHPKDKISFQFEKGGAVLLQNYAGSNMKIDVSVNVSGRKFLSIPLRKLLELVTYFRQAEKIVTKERFPRDFLERPRVKIEVNDA